MNFYVINIKKYFFTIIFIFFTIFLLAFSNNNFIAAQNGLALWATKVFPSIFPFFIATELLCQTNFIYLTGKLLNKFIKPIFNVPGESASALILGFLSGYPVGAKMVSNLKHEKIISNIEAERLIAYTNNSGPLFIVGTIGIGIFKSNKIGFILLISHILSSLLTGYFFKYWKKNKSETTFQEQKFNSKFTPIKFANLGEILYNAIKKSIFTSLIIGGFITFFAVFISILNTCGILNLITNFFKNFNINPIITNSIISGLIELTAGLDILGNIYLSNKTLSILIASFLLGIGGISILLQVYSIIYKEHISIKPYIIGKLSQGIFSVIITYILL